MADVDWGSVEDQLKEQAGQWYDPSMLQDVQRNSSYDAAGGANNVDDWIGRIADKAQLRGTNEVNSDYVANGEGGYTVGPTGTVNNPNNGPVSGSGVQGTFTGAPQQSTAPSTAPQYANDLVTQMMQQQAAQEAERKSRADALYGTLSDRASQSLTLDRNNPVIRAQADAFSAQQDRSARNYISDAAERGGPYANIEGTRRMAAEHAGQASGAFEANLMGQELAARRQEIAQALAQQGSQLSAEQQNEMQRQLALLDQSIKQQQIGLGHDTLNQEWQRTLLDNEQANNQLGASTQQSRAYYDWLWGHGG